MQLRFMGDGFACLDEARPRPEVTEPTHVHGCPYCYRKEPCAMSCTTWYLDEEERLAGDFTRCGRSACEAEWEIERIERARRELALSTLRKLQSR